jgi:4-hydroxyphenylpyruvate dioxygenase-like putative hemolysin
MPDDIEDFEDFRAAFTDLLAAAETAGIDSDAVTGLLTAQLAAMRGAVRLPLSIPPERAREFTNRAAEHRGESMEVELVVSGSILEDLELQLQVFERPGAAPDGDPGEE